MNFLADTETVSSQNARIEADKIIMIHSNTPGTLIGNLAACIPLSSILWDVESHASIIIWIGSVYVLSFIRWLHYRSLNPETASVERISLQGRVYTVFALLSGLTWGSTAVLFFHPDSLETLTFILLTLFLVLGASMISLSSRPLTHSAFAIPVAFPIIIIMFFQGSTYYSWMGAGALLYFVVTFSYSRNLGQVFSNSFELKYENMELVRDLKAQTETAIKANQDKSTFLAAASHDLRQPLHAVNLFVETLGHKLSTQAQRSDLDHISKGLDSLGELFGALLDITQLDSTTTRISKNNFPLEDLISRLIDQLNVEANTKNLNLAMHDCNYIVYSDSVLLERIISNLASNAIRYTERGSINIFCTRVNNENISLHVQDTGTGIPEEDRENIFNEFYQLQNPERDRNKGLGLGLAIVRRISLMLDLQLDFTSRLNEGTEFVIQIPIGADNKDVDSSPAVALVEDRLDKLKVLVIDNETEILHAMQSILGTWGCRFTGADSVENALELVADGYEPDFILADYRMPGEINGSELIKRIQTTLSDVPGIVITGDTDNDVIGEIRNSDQFILTKPIKPAQLRIAMTRLLN